MPVEAVPPPPISSARISQKPAARKPLLWAALAYSSGVGAGFFLWRPASWWVISGAILAVSAIYLRHRRDRVAKALVWAALFAFGALTIQVHEPSTASASVISFAEGREATVTAHVTKEGIPLQSSSGDIRQRLDLKIERLVVDDQTVTATAGVRVTFYSSGKGGDFPSPQFHYGERIRFNTKLNRPRNFRNPGAFDYAGYLAKSGIVALGSAKTEDVELLPGFAGNRFESWRTRIHHSTIEKIHRLWPTNQAALADAILIGENEFVGRDVLTDFQRTGTYHVLVISGLKVSILVLVTFWLLRRCRASDLAAYSITVLLAIAYAVLTDVGVPVWRSTLMVVLYLCARLLYRRRSVLNTIGAAGLALLLMDSQALFEASFQLSFLCVLVIAAIGAPILERSTQPLSSAARNLDSAGYDFVLPPALVQFRLDLRMLAGRLQRFFGARLPLKVLAAIVRVACLGCEFLVISIVLQVGFTLPMAYYFHRATLVSLPANVLAVPLTEVAMVASMAAIAISYVSISLASLPAAVAGVCLQAMEGSVRWLGALQVADTRVPTPQLLVILVGGAALVLAMALARRRLLLAGVGLAAITTTAAWICLVPPHPRFRPGILEITPIDVGQGDSILVVSPRGRTLLVDAGGIPQWMHSDLDIGEDVVSPYLWSRGIHHLDAVAVTHAHADHSGGMKAILANFHPGELWLSVDTPHLELEDLLHKANDLGIPVVSHQAGDRMESGGLAIHILAPSPDPTSHTRKRNDDSLVMTVTYGQTTALLEADAEKDMEKRIAHEQPRADLLKVAHHGSATSTIPELLAAVRPRFAVISVGARNVHGHPRREVLERLAESGVRTYRTDLDGAVTFYLDGKNVIPCPATLY